jgi:glycosyltransferase involved in cell wall biosynthesis
LASERLLFVINSLTGGGAERVFTTLLRSSPEQLSSYDVHVVLLDSEASAFALPAGVTVHQLDCRFKLGASLKELSALARQLQPDLIMSFLTRANVAAAFAGAISKTPVIISERNDTAAQLGHGRFPALARAMVGFAYRRAEHVIAVSSGVGDALRSEFHVDARRIRVINNPVDLESIQAAAQEEPKVPVSRDDVVMLARLEPQKNLGLAIEAFARSGRTGRLIILGEGSLRSELRRLADQLGLGDRLVMPGYVANPYAVLARAALFMLSSRHEGFCNSLVEAMAAGVPVLATDCRFSPAEILEVTKAPAAGEVAVGSGGLLVQVDDADALVAGLRMLQDEQLSSRLSHAGRTRVQDFGVARQVAMYWDAIAEIPKASPASGRGAPQRHGIYPREAI